MTASEYRGDPAAGRRRRPRRDPGRDAGAARLCRPVCRLDRCVVRRRSSAKRWQAKLGLGPSSALRHRRRHGLGRVQRLSDRLSRLLADHRHARRACRRARPVAADHQGLHRSSASATCSPSSATAAVLSIPVPVLDLAAVIFIIGAHIWYQTPCGRHMAAIGGAREAARALGIKAQAHPVLALCRLGLRLGGGRPDRHLGARRRLGVARPGNGARRADRHPARRGRVHRRARLAVRRSVRHVLFIGALSNGLIQINVSPYFQQVAVGIALVWPPGSTFCTSGWTASASTRKHARRARRETSDTVEQIRRSRGVNAAPPVLELAWHQQVLWAGAGAHAASAWRFARARWSALVGDNGAGKVTLISIVSGLAQPDRRHRSWSTASSKTFADRHRGARRRDRDRVPGAGAGADARHRRERLSRARTAARRPAGRWLAGSTRARCGARWRPASSGLGSTCRR